MILCQENGQKKLRFLLEPYRAIACWPLQSFKGTTLKGLERIKGFLKISSYFVKVQDIAFRMPRVPYNC